MKKRTFLKTSSALVAGSFIAPLISCTGSSKKAMTTQENLSRTNWAGNLVYSTKNFHQPHTVEEVQEVVQQCDKARVLGTRHCFNDIADSKFHQISIRQLNKIVNIDKQASTATIEGGASYGQVCAELHEKGYALHNLASLPHISIAGACATATHGSGMSNGNLATAVSAIEFVNAAGDLVRLSRKNNGEQFAGAVVNLGGLGVVTKVTLNLQPTFEVRQNVYQFLPVSELQHHFREIMGSGYSVSLFTDYNTDTVNQVWIKRKVEGDDFQAEPEFFGAIAATRDLHPIVELSAENCTAQMGVPGPWYDRLPHFKMGFTPSSGKELQSEYFIPMENAVDAYLAISQLKELIAPYLMISEVRTIAADDLWMSPCYKQPSVTYHFTWKQDWKGLEKVLPVIEATLQPFRVRPHWGKVFTIEPSRLQALYTKLPDFKDLLAEYDPEGKFRNDFLQKNLYS